MHKQTYILNYGTRVNFEEAIRCFASGFTIECRILSEEGYVVEIEKYNRCDGLSIAVEFNEIMYGHWFVLDN